MVAAAVHEALSSFYSKIASTKGDMDDVIWMVVSSTLPTGRKGVNRVPDTTDYFCPGSYDSWR